MKISWVDVATDFFAATIVCAIICVLVASFNIFVTKILLLIMIGLGIISLVSLTLSFIVNH